MICSRRLLGALCAAVAALLTISAGGDANAQYTLCNKSSYALKAAVGYVDQEALLTRGWWNLKSGECKRVLSEKVQPGRYYVYAEAIPGHRGPWKAFSGQTVLCVQNGSLFTLRDQKVCADDPRQQREFKAVDVGENAEGIWTIEFTDERNYTVFAAEVAGVQRLLRDIGLYSGAIDGSLGEGTKAAIRNFAKSKNLTTSNAINDTLIDALVDEANSSEASEGFFLCNDTMLPVWAAFAQPADGKEDYVSSGWWLLETQGCAKVRRGNPGGKDYYVYGVMEAENRSVPLAGGEGSFCVADVQFEADGGTSCEEAGYDTAAFRRVGVDGEASSQTFTFTPELFNPDFVQR